MASKKGAARRREAVTAPGVNPKLRQFLQEVNTKVFGTTTTTTTTTTAAATTTAG